MPDWIRRYLSSKESQKACKIYEEAILSDPFLLSQFMKDYDISQSGLENYQNDLDKLEEEELRKLEEIDYDELDAFFAVNKKLADKYGMQCWTNAETFDRDMPIDFLPIKFDKLRMKLEAAKRAGYDKAITFEFSHFMSPQSAYLQAGHLYNRYKEYFNIR